jgi:MYXO-CTERM domain-containing protein
VAAQEIAHSFGLDHEFLCADPMTYLNGCGAKSFQDVAAPCGEDQARDCAQAGQYDCGYNQQNSVQLMTARIGLNEGGTGGNDISIAAPVDGANVSPGFEVNASIDFASSVELRIDGVSIATLSSGPFLFSTPSDLSVGTHVVEIIATVSGSSVTDSISVNLVDDGSGDGNGGGGGGDGNGGGGGDGTGPNGETPQVIGGCSTGGSGSGSAAFLLGLALLFLRRRETLG